MVQNVTSLTSKGQVTIPKAIRDELGLRPCDKIRFIIEDGDVKLEKAYLSLDEIVGILPAPCCEIDIDKAITLAKDERARELVRKLRDE